jgi:hypothetical protein
MERPRIIIAASEEEKQSILKKLNLAHGKPVAGYAPKAVQPAVQPVAQVQSPEPAPASKRPGPPPERLDLSPALLTKPEPQVKALEAPQLTQIKSHTPSQEGKLYSVAQFAKKSGIPEDIVLKMTSRSDNFTLPAGVAALNFGNGWHLFVQDDYFSAPPPGQPEKAKEPETFTELEQVAETFDEYMSKLEEMDLRGSTSSLELVKEEPSTAPQPTSQWKMNHPLGINQLRTLYKQGKRAGFLCRVYGITLEELQHHCGDLMAPKTAPKAAKSEPPEALQIAIPYNEPEEAKEVKPVPKALLSISSLRERFRKKCNKVKHHWVWLDKSAPKPTFTVDGKSYPIRRAAYMLYRTENNQPAHIPDGYDVVAICGKHNCVSPQCIEIVPEAIARSKRAVTRADVEEVARLKNLGNSYAQISEIMQKHGPATVYAIDKGLKGLKHVNFS